MLSEYLQTFIHCLNKDCVRTSLINQYITSNEYNDIEWLGTWYVHNVNNKTLEISQSSNFFPRISEELYTALSKRKNKLVRGKRYKTFTVCIIYEINKVHYVAFVYDKKEKELISFDPGIELYFHGIKTIIPSIRNIFKKLDLIKKKGKIIGSCNDFLLAGKQAGIQYNGKKYTNLPADAFCQTWTLFFICKLISIRKISFVNDWCKIPPKYRENYLLASFIIPILEQNKYVASQYFSMNEDSSEYIMELLGSHTIKSLFCQSSKLK